MPDTARPIDVTFDVRSDAGNGDPDSTSATLRRYHQLLWTKALPDGRHLTLDGSRRGSYYYLHHKSEGLGEHRLRSDTVVPTFRSWKRKGMRELIAQISSQELDDFQRINHTIGAMMIFPGNKLPGVQTMNGGRGMNPLIADRFDLTLESIRLHYLGLQHPLDGVMTAYRDFFDLFLDFENYVDFFLLQDLVDDAGSVRFFLPFSSFGVGTLPRTVDEYREYRDNAVAFITARNARIERWARSQLVVQ
jgi:hypothetical protein